MAVNVAYSAALSQNCDQKSKHVSGNVTESESVFFHPSLMLLHFQIPVWVMCDPGRRFGVTGLQDQLRSLNTTEMPNSGSRRTSLALPLNEESRATLVSGAG